MTREEEFDIMKLVLDKFLWLGVIIMGYGFYKIITLNESLSYGFAIMLAGAILLIIFMVLLIKEYNFMK
jgi:Ca2+/Na+ antiporter